MVLGAAISNVDSAMLSTLSETPYTCRNGVGCELPALPRRDVVGDDEASLHDPVYVAVTLRPGIFTPTYVVQKQA